MNTINIMDAKQAFAVPGEDSLIDCINPHTNRSWINNEDLNQIRERYPLAEIVNIEEFCAVKGAKQDSPIEWLEVTRERYWEMLEVLPPAAYLPVAETGYYPNITHGFLVGEPWDHHAVNGQPRFAAFLKRGHTGVKSSDAKFYESNRPLTRKEFLAIPTWDRIERKA